MDRTSRQHNECWPSPQMMTPCARRYKRQRKTGMLVVTMANLPHADLALNLAFSAVRAGAPLFAFALSDATYDKLRTHNVACGKLPTLFGSVDGRKDVQITGSRKLQF